MLKKIIKALKHVFCLKCPDCKGDLEVKMLDMYFDRLVYRCRDCGKEFI